VETQRPTGRRTIIEPFRIKMVEKLEMRSREERERAARDAGYNLFQIPARMVTFDLLTDSGTAAMSTEQWSAMMVADESYAGSRSFDRFAAVVREITGYSHVLPVHQGRAAERLLFGHLVRPGNVIPSNNHFDTTRANIEQSGGETVDLVIPEGRDPASPHPFKGNIDLARLEAFCSENRGRIPFGMMTITNNSGGGQPVSLENLRGASAIYRRHGIPFLLDACRFAENSCFIRSREPGQSGRSVREIALETFGLADGAYMSGKKDALVNMGGFIALRSRDWLDGLQQSLILGEGYLTYGGLAARDLEAMAVGLHEGLEEDYLEYRLATTRYMCEGLTRIGVPVVQPAGGHAVFIDAKALLPQIPPHEFPALSLAVELFLSEGVRAVEIGSAALGRRRQDGSFEAPAMELVRLAFPRRCYTQSHFDWILEGIGELHARRRELRGFRRVHEPPRLRNFLSRYEPI
jgi:tyrosine phenol-lyase